MNDHIIDTAKVWFVNGTVFGVVTFSTLESIGKLLLLGLTIGYTVWKWRNDSRKGK